MFEPLVALSPPPNLTLPSTLAGVQPDHLPTPDGLLPGAGGGHRGERHVVRALDAGGRVGFARPLGHLRAAGALALAQVPAHDLGGDRLRPAGARGAVRRREVGGRLAGRVPEATAVLGVLLHALRHAHVRGDLVVRPLVDAAPPPAALHPGSDAAPHLLAWGLRGLSPRKSRRPRFRPAGAPTPTPSPSPSSR